MGKFYSKASTKNLHDLTPNDQSISFILNYSKSLKVVNLEKLKFEMILN